MLTCTFEDGKNTSTLRHAVVDTIVLQEAKILLVKRSEKLLLEGGKWALPGGYINTGETIRDAALREVYEETGYLLQKLTFFGILDNPNRPHEDRQNIAFVFFAQAGEKTGTPDWEVQECAWLPLHMLAEKETVAFDHYQTIRKYIQYQHQAFPLPVFL